MFGNTHGLYGGIPALPFGGMQYPAYRQTLAGCLLHIATSINDQSSPWSTPPFYSRGAFRQLSGFFNYPGFNQVLLHGNQLYAVARKSSILNG